MIVRRNKHFIYKIIIIIILGWPERQEAANNSGSQDKETGQRSGEQINALHSALR
jgi:hypothetical protein